MTDTWWKTKDDTNEALLRGVVAEFIGVFLFVFAGCLTALATHDMVAIAFAFGLSIMVQVFAMGPISGGHLNPAVSLALLVTNHCSGMRALLWTVAQFTGGACGAFFVKLIVPEAMMHDGSFLAATTLGHGMGAWQGCLMEIFTTFCLVFVIFGTVVDASKRNALTPYFAAIPIGFAVVLGICASGSLSGGSMNPARSFGPALASGEWKNHWVYWIGPYVGGLIAGLTYEHAFTSRLSSD